MKEASLENVEWMPLVGADETMSESLRGERDQFVKMGYRKDQLILITYGGSWRFDVRVAPLLVVMESFDVELRI